MNKRQFVAQRKAIWRRFEMLVQKLDTKRLAKIPAQEAAEFSRLFRETCYDLALIRSRDWGQGLVSYLNNLVSRGHNCFYSAPPGNLTNLLQFLASGFPRVFRANIGYFYVAAALFFVPLGVSWAVIQYEPRLASRIVDSQQLDAYDAMYKKHEPSTSTKPDEDSGTEGRSSGMGAIMSGFYIWHNVGIALNCFARGILLGIGTVYTLIFNGVAIGAVAGYMIAQGHSERFLSFVITHGSFELTGIAVAGGAGLMLGDSLIRPGQRTRIESLRQRGLEAIQVACGAAAMLMVAAMIEAFWSPSGVPVVAKYSVGVLMWLLVALYLATSGRREAAL